MREHARRDFSTCVRPRLAIVASLILSGLQGCSAPASRVRENMSLAPESIRGAMIADVHVHVTMKEAVPFFHGAPGTVLATNPDATLVNQVDAETLKAHSVRVLFATLWPPPAMRPGRSALDEALVQLQALKDLPRTDSGFAVALCAEAALKIAASGRVALIPSLEGAEAIGRVEDVDTLYAAGFRSIGLVHFTDNAIADAEDGQFGTLASPLFDGHGKGLTELGRAAVMRMFELGVLVDVAHASPSTVEDVLKLAEAKRTPILSSHVGSGMTVAHTLSDDHARRIAALGGLIGVGLYRHDMLVKIPDEDRFDGFVDGTCDEAIAHWLHFQRVAGPDAVVLGSDLSSLIHRGRAGGSCPNGLRSAADLGALFAALIDRGVPATTLAGSGERVLSVLQRCEQAASAVPNVQRPPPTRTMDDSAL